MGQSLAAILWCLNLIPPINTLAIPFTLLNFCSYPDLGSSSSRSVRDLRLELGLGGLGLEVTPDLELFPSQAGSTVIGAPATPVHVCNGRERGGFV
jgi:hypothetical protein